MPRSRAATVIAAVSLKNPGPPTRQSVDEYRSLRETVIWGAGKLYVPEHCCGGGIYSFFFRAWEQWPSRSRLGPGEGLEGPEGPALGLLQLYTHGAARQKGNAHPDSVSLDGVLLRRVSLPSSPSSPSPPSMGTGNKQEKTGVFLGM